MPVEEWDVDCHDCHVRTDKRGIQVIHETGDTEIDYNELADVELFTIPRANVLARAAYVWGIIALTTLTIGLVMVSLVEFREPFTTAYVGTVAVIGSIALYRLGRTVKSKRDGEQAVQMALETTDGERITFTRDDEWPTGFDSHMLSKAGND